MSSNNNPDLGYTLGQTLSSSTNKQKKAPWYNYRSFIPTNE